jgi:hypothetical protein
MPKFGQFGTNKEDSGGIIGTIVKKQGISQKFADWTVPKSGLALCRKICYAIPDKKRHGGV